MVKNILVVECVTTYNWYKVFDGATLTSGEKIRVEQASWQEISMTGYYDSGLIVEMQKARRPLPDTPQNKSRTIKPHFVLIRSLSQFLNDSSKNLLYAIQFCNIPTINSFRSIYGMLEKPVVFGELRKVQKRLSKQNISFPLVEPTYYPTYRSMIIAPSFPLVIKIGHHHAGYGKIKCDTKHRFDDVKSIVACHNDYCTAEEFINYDFEIRIQKIGPSIKCFKRRSMNWKGNVGNASINEDAEVTQQFKIMIREASSIFGGLDICALDLVHDTKTDSFKILELNGTAIGLVQRHKEEDMKCMRDLVITKMSQIYASIDKKKESKINEENKEEKNENDDDIIINDNDVNINDKGKTSKVDDDEALLLAVQKIRKLEEQNEGLKREADRKKDCLIM